MKEKFSECQRPFSPCWCETRQNNPHCKTAPSVPIQSDLFTLILVVAIFIYSFIIFRKYMLTPKYKKTNQPT